MAASEPRGDQMQKLDLKIEAEIFFTQLPSSRAAVYQSRSRGSNQSKRARAHGASPERLSTASSSRAHGRGIAGFVYQPEPRGEVASLGERG